MHKLLQRQLKKAELKEEDFSQECLSLIKLISRTYDEMDADRALTYRSLELTSDEMEEANKKLRDSISELEKLSLVIENSFEGVLITDQDGIIQYVNSRWEMETGYSATEVVGIARPSILKSGKHSQKLYEKIWDTLKKGETFRGEMINKRKDGSLLYIDAVMFPVKKQGEIYFVEVSRDITKDKENERKIKELNQLRDKFINIVAHQLRTPLSAIRWNLEALLDGDFGKLEKMQEEFVRVTYTAEIRVINRIHAMLVAIDIEEGRVTLQNEMTSISTIFGTALSKWKRECNLKMQKSIFDSNAFKLPSINIDPQKILEVFDVLLSNSSMYTHDKGEIRAEFTENNGMLRFTVTDSGIGIPVAEQNMVFSRFYRASNAASMETDAPGLGLYIANEYIKLHKGKMGFTSAEGKGSSFWFELPMNAEEEI